MSRDRLAPEQDETSVVYALVMIVLVDDLKTVNDELEVECSTGATLFGDGVYATAGSGALVPGASSIPMTVGGQGFMRAAGNAAFLNGGSALTGGWASGWAGVANAGAVAHKVVACP